MSSISPSTASARSVAEEFVSVVMHVMKQSSTPMVEFAERHDLSFTQLKLMFALANADEPLPIGRLAELSGASLPAAGRAVDGLVRHGLATRTEDPDDRRVKRVEITELGSTGMAAINESRIATLSDFLGGLSDTELAALADAVAPLRGLAENPESRTEVSR